MPIMPAICSQCGAILEVDSSLEAAVCKHCGTPFVIEKAINNYKVTNNTVNNIANASISSVDKNTEFNRALGHLRLGNYDLAGKAFSNLIEYYPDFWGGWYGKVITDTNGFFVSWKEGRRSGIKMPTDYVGESGFFLENYNEEEYLMTCIKNAISSSDGSLKETLETISKSVKTGLSELKKDREHYGKITTDYEETLRTVSELMHKGDRRNKKTGEWYRVYPDKTNENIQVSDVKSNEDESSGVGFSAIFSLILSVITVVLWGGGHGFWAILVAIAAIFFWLVTFSIPSQNRERNATNGMLRDAIENRDKLSDEMNRCKAKKIYFNFNYMEPFEIYMGK